MAKIVSCCAVSFTFLLITACVTPPPTVTPAPTLPVWEKDYPLAMGNVWVYHAMRYDGFNPDDIMTVASVITQTVVEIKDTPSYFAAKIRQESSAEVPVYVPLSMREIPPNPAASEEYWLIVDGNRIYRENLTLDLPNLAITGTLELQFPLDLDSKWYEVDEMNKLFPDQKNESMLRRVTQLGKVNTPTGTFDHCSLIEEIIGGGTFENWFCPGVGWVDLKNDHHGTPFGSRWILIKYQVK